MPMKERDYILATNLARLYEINRMLREMTFPVPRKKLDGVQFLPNDRTKAIEAVGAMLARHQRALNIEVEG